MVCIQINGDFEISGISKSPVDQTYEPSLLTIFSYVYAAQSLAQFAYFRHGQFAYFKNGFEISQLSSWVYLFLAITVFLFPGRVRTFCAMLVFGLAHYISMSPFMANHHKADQILVVLMLVAAFVVFGRQLLTAQRIDEENTERWFQKFAPVAGAIFAFVYFSIIISKLNSAFFDLEISCLTGMIEEAEANRQLVTPFLGLFSVEFYFWFFIVAETALPIMLVFRQTRLLAFYFGVPFHLLLGLLGHWPFSAMMLSLYTLVCAPMLKELLTPILGKINSIRGAHVPWMSGALLFAAFNILVLVSAFLSKPSVTWLLWTSTLAAIILVGTIREHTRHGLFGGTGVVDFWVSRPGFLWVMLILAIVNSSGPYLGWNTKTAVAMYSNMRTEGEFNNHYFMPKVPLFGFDNLVEVIDSNNEQVLSMKTHSPLYGFVGQEIGVYQTYFEFRRAISDIEQDDLEITYEKDGEVRTFRRGAETNVDSDLDVQPPFLLSKFLYFRPVFKGERSYCLH